MPEKINIAIVDDHTPFREGLISLFEKFNDLRVVFDAADGNEAITKLKSNLVDIILMDLDMDGMNGDEAYDIIKQKYPEVKVIIVTGHYNDSFVIRFIKKQVPSILSKTTSIKKIVDTIRNVHKHGHYFDEVIADIMAKSIFDSANDPQVNLKPELDLNIQELQVLKLMCLGYSTKKIAEKVHRAERTIDYNRNCIWHKTKIKSKSIQELTLFALKHKILSIF